MKEKYLPIGTVVKLDEIDMKLMIKGYLPIPNEDQTKIYDYSAVMFPVGEYDSNQVIVFNHSNIKEIVHMGCEDESFQEFLPDLIQAANESPLKVVDVPSKSSEPAVIQPQPVSPADDLSEVSISPLSGLVVDYSNIETL